MTTNSLQTISDRELLDRIERAAGAERNATAELLALLAEVDARRLYLGEGCSSLFTYCTQVLRLSEHAAYHRIEAGRAARRFPVVLELVADGSVTLTTVAMLRPHLTAENHESLLAAARHKTKREVEHQIACLAPRPDAPTVIRKLPAPESVKNDSDSRDKVHATPPARSADELIDAPPSEAAQAPGPKPLTAPISADRYLLRVTLSADTYARLRRAQELMGHRASNGDAAGILDKALTLLVEELERVKVAKVRRPRAAEPQSQASPSSSSPGSRHIPAAVRREVWKRDDGRCAFVGPRGRCTETSRLEFHHIEPFARGGPTTVRNLALRCRAHNGFESELAFGRWSGTVVLGSDQHSAGRGAGTRSGPSS